MRVPAFVCPRNVSVHNDDYSRFALVAGRGARVYRNREPPPPVTATLPAVSGGLTALNIASFIAHFIAQGWTPPPLLQPHSPRRGRCMHFPVRPH